MVEPIAVIGSGCRFPGGSDTPSKLWSLIREPHDLSKNPPPSRFDLDLFYHTVGTHHGTTNATKSYWLEDSDRTNVCQFDAGFFNIQPSEVDAMDPQQRLLMEVVYDSLCAAGQPMEKLRGSDTAVYVGMMSDDWSTMLTRDWETLPRYTATGLERGIMANRLSYFFGWHGPSMTVDTACSSSLVALDLAVQMLRNGKSKVAVAAGTNLILSPAMYISESNLGMLSPNGRCAMWDAAADGYARGEGVAAVIIKTLSQALADNDPIECIIRETAVNQDGRTAGLTMPSNLAQAALIRECYARAGLDPVHNFQDRPQFFHAHGTGTQAGDPQEAEAIASSLFPSGSLAAQKAPKLRVGSIKTVIGHTEGTAGLASLIGTSMALQKKLMPPNLHFQNLSSKVTPFFDNLEIPTTAIPWDVAEDQVRRASVNSFGFGGTNAHCILEEYIPSTKKAASAQSGVLFTPLIFSASSESSLREMISQHLSYLRASPETDLRDLAYTLQSRRSTLAYRKFVPAPTVQQAIEELEKIEGAGFSTRHAQLSRPAKILGIFTGQGAQWPRMGARLIETSTFAKCRISQLDEALQSLPNPVDRPTWSICDQLLAGKEASHINEAALSQPLCSAVQIVLVDILRAAGITFAAVVGHSSGEIGAAYAAGHISDRDAIRIAYFRGVHAKLAASPNLHAPRGAMMAVGTSSEEARAFCIEHFSGRLQLAAVNSPSSVTLSGDEEAVDEAEQLYKSQGIFARKLKVDTAYHSMHMSACAVPYLTSLDSCDIQSIQPPANVTTTWYSSVFDGRPMTSSRLTNQYWVDNMCNAVLFSGALERAVEDAGPFDLAIEVGPHPALKGPATATIDAKSSVPYTGLFSRGQDDGYSLSNALGFVWAQLGSDSVRFTAVEQLLSGNTEPQAVLRDLPPYPFDHQRDYWHNSRLGNQFKSRKAHQLPNPVLGSPCSEATTPGEYQWRNILQPGEVPWLNGHRLQGQTVFPAMGYVSMAVEAINAVLLDCRPGSSMRLLKLTDLDIPRAIVFDDDSSTVETIFSILSVNSSDVHIAAEWVCYSVDGSGSMVLNARGRVRAELAVPEPNTLPLMMEDSFNLVPVGVDRFYSNLSRVGYNYTSPFQGVFNIRRKPGYSTGDLFDQSGCTWEDGLILHPGMLDSALQTVFAAWSYPGDTQLWSLHVPVSISAITVNPYFTTLSAGGKRSKMRFETFIRSKQDAKVVSDIYLQTADGPNTFVQFEGATLVPFSPGNPKTDVPMFSRFEYAPAFPDGQLVGNREALSNYEVQLYKDVDRIAYWFARNASVSIPAAERTRLLPHFQKYLAWCDRMVNMVTQGAISKVPASCNSDSREDIGKILARYEDRKDVRFVQVVGDNLLSVIKAGSSMLEHMNQDGLLRAFYEEGAICSGPTGRWLARILYQISHRYPGLNIFEVGAGTGATTSAVLDALDGRYSSYTFTDISSGFFIAAEERFADHAGRMLFKTFNMEQQPDGQGFDEGSYDVVVAVNVLHVSADMEASLSNVRRLLKPGGFLVVAELTSTDLLFSGMTVGTLPGWWIGAETGRPWGPLLTLTQWDMVLKNSGFGGIDTVSPDISTSLPMSVFVSQAVDDRVTLLRDPLSVEAHPPGVRTDALVIIGGTTWPVYTLAQQMSDIIGKRFQEKQHFLTVEDFAKSDIAHAAATSGGVSVLSLTDLDHPYLENLTADKFDAFKVCAACAGVLVWVTCGAKEDHPYSAMMTGIARTIKTENPRLNIQMFDLDPAMRKGIYANTVSELAGTLLCQLALSCWGTESLLWTLEPEVIVRNGRQLIPRLLPDCEKNDRYNSHRRAIFAKARPSKESLQLVGMNHGKANALELRLVSPLAQTSVPTTNYCTIRITYSLLQSVAIGATGFFRLCVGVNIDTHETVLALSSSTDSPVKVPTQCCIPLGVASASSALLSLAANLVATQILNFTQEGGTLLINEADSQLKAAVQSKAQLKNVNTVFTTRNLTEEDSASIFLHPSFPRHVIQSIIPRSTTLFVDFSRDSSHTIRDAILPCLPAGCLRIDVGALLSNEVNGTVAPKSLNQLAQQFHQAYDDTIESNLSVKCIPLDAVSTHKVVGGPPAVVDWAATDCVSAKVQPIDSGTLFRGDRTYLFVGMAGELGQSLAGWMISHGARYIVLTSRTPKVHPKFVDEMISRYGAVVKAVPLDITSPESLSSVHAAMSASLPPIAGVINGAMILDDELFANMTHEQFERVTKPKVVGTLLLDELFYDDASLDFFVVASSIASIIGWSGQSNYSAANEFMTSLVTKRRKRGVAASVMNIPAVLGVGYAAHSDTFSFDYFQSLGYINIGEEDLHILLAEAILSGRPGQLSDGKSQVVMGVDYVPAGLYVKEAHRRDVKFNHFILREESGSEAQTVKAGERVRVQLQSANGPDAEYTVIRDALVMHFKRLLRMTEEQKLDESVGLVDQGVDSLVAVDLRAWFLKELEVDVPTLKIMGGASIADLVKTAVDNMPQSSECDSGESSPKAVGKTTSSSFPAQPEGVLLRSRWERAPTTSTPLSSGSPIFTPAQVTTPSTSGIDSGRASPPQDYFDKLSSGVEKPVAVDGLRSEI
ncbi:uncharacterized protein BJX67DRAFT_386006 [Aspergillus lucknowensis]|uniref:Uncharacterized protein n=1 Tax=Aspergillus lucknowensis TaxID=176173 RepID=A0ABR4L9F4_9EURO